MHAVTASLTLQVSPEYHAPPSGPNYKGDSAVTRADTVLK
jgi:hypothetical protein